MKTIAATLLTLGALAALAWGQDGSAAKEWARLQLSQEMTDCAAFYVMCAEHQRKRGDIENARTSAMLAEFLLDRAINMEAEDVVMAQARATMSRFRSEVRADPDSIHALVERHGQSCWDSWKDRDARLAWWMENWHIGP